MLFCLQRLIRPPAQNTYSTSCLIEGDRSDTKSLPANRELEVHFEQSDNLANALMLFSDSEGFHSTAVLKLYDMDNRVLVSSKSKKRKRHSK